jgi:hypothetical protein
MTNRFDIYLHVHKGLRAFMTDVLTTVGRIDGSDSIDVAAGVAQVRALLDICRAHLFTENQFVHPAMEARCSGSSCVTANQHVEHEQALEQLEARLRAVETACQANLDASILDLYRSLALFVADNFQHMDTEERENNETLWALYTDSELHALHAEIMASLDPRKVEVFLSRWILPSVSHRERAAILAGMERAALEPVSHFN